MNSLSYWEKRKANEMFHYMEQAEKKAEEISKLYLKSSRYLSLEAEEVFERFRKKHKLSEAEARRLLNTLQDKTSIDELKRALGADDGSQAKAEPLAELESPAYRARIERFEQLQNQLDATMQQVYRKEKAQSREFYLDLGKEAYYQSVFDVQQMAGLAFSFGVVDQKAIERVINSRWSGANYSQRIWNNTQALSQDLKEELMINLVTGRTDREASEIIADKFAVGASKARRLVRTESCNLTNQMEMLSYEECGIGTYIFLATLDKKTSETCRSLDGKRFPVEKQQPGKNCPPMHPWCRSTTICDISDEELAQMKRRARDPVTGKTKTVPADMTYPEWKKVVDEGGDFGKWKAEQEAWAEARGAYHTRNEELLDYTTKYIEGVTAKPIAKASGSDIMELSRKLDDPRDGFNFISDEAFNNLTISARKKGAVIIRGTKEAEEHLEKLGAAASNIGDVLMFRKDVCISEVLEEVHHFEQNLSKLNEDKGEPLRSILNEIDAKQYLLDNADKFKIPRNELELTKKQLQSYQEQLKEYEGR